MIHPAIPYYLPDARSTTWPPVVGELVRVKSLADLSSPPTPNFYQGKIIFVRFHRAP